MASVTLTGFKTVEQAQEFMDWYEGGGEQAFAQHLDDVGKEGPWQVDVCYKGNSGRYWDITEDAFTVRVK